MITAMNRSAEERGVPVFPAFVFAVVLGLAFSALHVTDPQYAYNPQSELAAATPPSTPLPPKKPDALNNLQNAQQQKCQTQKQNAVGKGQSDPNSQQFKTNTTEKNMCVGAVYDGDIPECQNSKGSKDKNDVNCYKCVGESTQVSIKANGQGNIFSSAVSKESKVPQGSCMSQFCDAAGKCSNATLVQGDKNLQQWATNDPAVFNSLPDAAKNGVLSYGPLDQSQQGPINDAFKNASDEIKSKTEFCFTAGADCQSVDINKQIAQAAGLCGSAPLDSSTCSVDPTKASADLQKKQDAFAAQMQGLAGSKVVLAPPPGAQPPAGAQPPPGAQPPGGQQQTFGSGGGGGGPGGGPPGGGGGGGSPLSALGSFLSGLAQGMKPQPPQPQQAPAQTCSTDPNIYAQQQQQYQQQLQQYNYQLQQYNYQQQLNQYYSNQNPNYNAPPQAPSPVQPSPCSPSTGQQCGYQPARPPASGCTVGTWTASMSGACIAGWLCTPNSSGAPAASLSCSPHIADVGSTLSIAYACSSGVASSSSFMVGTQPSGTATTTIATPPAGTNTGTYSLTCTNQGQTAGAQCSVQIVNTSIILVANPATVQNGSTTLIGWITAGMQSCVISSPDQTDFTSNNAFDTSPNGTATSSPITTSTRFVLDCKTLSGANKEASTTVGVSN